MAEFMQMMKDWKRMCDTYNHCSDCPLNDDGDTCLHASRGKWPKSVDNLERRVMAWAAEHPEPVYPTWLEYLARYCGAPQKIDLVPFGFAEEVHGVLPETYIHWLMKHRIPADTAQKLGLQPKEG